MTYIIPRDKYYPPESMKRINLFDKLKFENSIDDDKKPFKFNTKELEYQISETDFSLDQIKDLFNFYNYSYIADEIEIQNLKHGKYQNLTGKELLNLLDEINNTYCTKLEFYKTSN